MIRDQKSIETNFEQCFKNYFQVLYRYAYTFVADESTAEEIVQNVFMKLWEKNKSLDVATSLNAYLYRSVHNECLNFLRKEKIKLKFREHTLSTSSNIVNNEPSKELFETYTLALNELDELTRQIFHLSRNENMTYTAIAQELDLSVKSVEYYMGKALKHLRLRLKEFLPLILLHLMSNHY